MLNAKNWKELKKQLRLLQGKAIFELERHNSLNDGVFLRVLHQVKPHELIFFDGKEKVYLSISEDSEQKMDFFENGFSTMNCRYTLKQIMEGQEVTTYKEYIEDLKKKWIGKVVMYEGEKYNVLDIDYNGMLLIDKKTRFTDTTAVSILSVKKQ